MIAAVAVSAGVPIAFITFVRRLDLYASGGLATVLACLLWGVVAFGLAFVINTRVAAVTTLFLLTVVFAPILEEVLKSLILVVLVRRPNFTYFVDGAIFGFACGTGFAIVENLDYLRFRADPLPFAINRAFTTSLMHGTASSLVGVSLGRFRFSRRRTRVGSLLAGWGCAIGLHSTFNLLTHRPPSPMLVYLFWAVGLGGVALVAVFIRVGLREERVWLNESLTLEVGVSGEEAAIVQELKRVDKLLKPVEARFGAEKTRLVRELLQLQAAMGLKRKAAALTPDTGLAAQLATQVEALQKQIADMQAQVGIYCMTYVRSIFPPGGDPIWEGLDRALSRADQQEPTVDVWGALQGRATS